MGGKGSNLGESAGTHIFSSIFCTSHHNPICMIIMYMYHYVLLSICIYKPSDDLK